MAVNVAVKTNMAELSKRFATAGMDINRELPILVKRCAAETAEELLRMSYPAVNNNIHSKTGGTPSAMAQARKNIERDVNANYKPIAELKIGAILMAREEQVLWSIPSTIHWRNPALKKAWDNRDFERLYGAFRKAGWTEADIGHRFSIVDKPEDSIQKISENINQSMAAVGMAPTYVRDPASIKTAILNKLKNVGKMAGGWFRACKALGQATVYNLPHQGSGGAKITDGGMTVEVYNEYGDYGGLISEKGVFDEVTPASGEKLKESAMGAVAKAFQAQQNK
jgi:hypothetical protein